NAELLWKAGQYHLALQFIVASQSGSRSRSQELLLTVLGVLNRGVALPKLNSVLTVPAQRLEATIAGAVKAGLLEADGSLTDFGKDLLKRARKGQRPKNNEIRPNQTAVKSYFPTQFFGVRRKSRKEPAGS